MLFKNTPPSKDNLPQKKKKSPSRNQKPLYFLIVRFEFEFTFKIWVWKDLSKTSARYDSKFWITIESLKIDNHNQSVNPLFSYMKEQIGNSELH